MTNNGSYVLHHHLGHEYPLVTHAEGLCFFDHHGMRYLDAAGAVGVVNLGYGIPEVAEAIANQAMTLAFAYGGSVTNRPQEDLATRLQT